MEARIAVSGYVISWADPPFDVASHKLGQKTEKCFEEDEEVMMWLSSLVISQTVIADVSWHAWRAQANFDGSEVSSVGSWNIFKNCKL